MRSLAVHEHKLYFTYQDTDGQRQTLVYDILEKFWKHYQFGRAAEALHGDDEDDLLIGSLNLGTTYTHTGTSDAGLPIASRIRTGSVSGGKREEKLIGDAFGTTAQGPQRAHSIAMEVAWSSASAQPILYQAGVAITPQPEITNR